MENDPKSETYTEAETKARAAATLQRMLATPHKPHKPKIDLAKSETRD